jgi:hypothetical protein
MACFASAPAVLAKVVSVGGDFFSGPEARTECDLPRLSRRIWVEESCSAACNCNCKCCLRKPVMCRGRLTLEVKQKVGSMVDEIFFGERKIKAAGGPHDRDASEEDTRT